MEKVVTGTIILERSLSFEMQQGPQARGVGHSRKFSGRNSELCQIILRQVDPPQHSVFFYVADDVGELKRQTQPFRQRFGGRVFVSEDVNANQSDYRSHVVAVALQLLKIAVLNWMPRIILVRIFVFHVHGRAKSQLIKQANWNAESALRIDYRKKHGIVGRMSALRGVKRIQPRIELLFAVAG